MKVKIALVGPSEAGKTTLTRTLIQTGNEGTGGGGDPEGSGTRVPYRPTNSVRILEIPITNIELKKYNVEIDAQIWDVGGSPRLKSIWPAVQKDMDGVIIVYNPGIEAQAREASAFHSNFLTQGPSSAPSLTPGQCLIIANLFRGSREGPGLSKLSGVSGRVRHLALNLEDDSNQVREEFRSFVTTIGQIVHDREKVNFVGLQRPNTCVINVQPKSLNIHPHRPKRLGPPGPINPTEIGSTTISALKYTSTTNLRGRSEGPGSEEVPQPFMMTRATTAAPFTNMSTTTRKKGRGHTAHRSVWEGDEE